MTSHLNTNEYYEVLVLDWDEDGNQVGYYALYPVPTDGSERASVIESAHI